MDPEQRRYGHGRIFTGPTTSSLHTRGFKHRYVHARAHKSLHGLIPKVPTCLIPYGRNPDSKASQGKPSSLTCHAHTWQDFLFDNRARRSIVCGLTSRSNKLSLAWVLRECTELADTSKNFLGSIVVGNLPLFASTVSALTGHSNY